MKANNLKGPHFAIIILPNLILNVVTGHQKQ